MEKRNGNGDSHPCISISSLIRLSLGVSTVVKPEWGTKRACPKCGTRFYDLQQEDPVTCISCGNEWVPEPVLKSKQPLPFGEEEKKEREKADADLSEEDLNIDEDEDNPEEDVDLGGDDDLGVANRENEEEN